MCVCVQRARERKREYEILYINTSIDFIYVYIYMFNYIYIGTYDKIKDDIEIIWNMIFNYCFMLHLIRVESMKLIKKS